MSEVYLLCGHGPDSDIICRQCAASQVAALRARIERLKGALSDIQKPHPHKINYTWQNGHIINGRVKKCMAIEIAAKALSEDAGE